jgi:hypothetical protein
MAFQESPIGTYIQEQRSNFEDMLGQMVETPSVSSDPDRASDMQKMAELAVEHLEQFGARAAIVNTKGYPSVAGEWWAGRQYPSVTIYNHLGSGTRMATIAICLSQRRRPLLWPWYDG